MSMQYGYSTFIFYGPYHRIFNEPTKNQVDCILVRLSRILKPSKVTLLFEILKNGIGQAFPKNFLKSNFFGNFGFRETIVFIFIQDLFKVQTQCAY